MSIETISIRKQAMDYFKGYMPEELKIKGEKIIKVKFPQEAKFEQKTR